MAVMKEKSVDLPWEFPEIQVVPGDGTDKDGEAKALLGPQHRERSGSEPSKARRTFGRLAMKVISNIMERNDRKQESPIMEQEEELVECEVATSTPDTPKLVVSKVSTKPTSHRSSTTKSPGIWSSSNDLRKSQGQLPDIRDNGPPSRKSSMAPTSKFQFASLVRLAKFRRMAAKFDGKSSRTSSRRTSISDMDEDPPLPDSPRFSATLSPEAQYAMMKGYEDVLIQHLRNSHKSNNFLFRVKTPHQKVAAIHLAEVKQSLKNKELTASRSRADIMGHLGLPSREETLLKSFPASPQSSRPPSSDAYRRTKGWGNHNQSMNLKERSMTNHKMKLPSISKDRQLKLSVRFQRAMDILDTIKDSEGVPVTSLKEKRTVSNPVANYNTWSQSWSREFKFQYIQTES